MRWEKVQLNTRPRETLEGKKSPGRLGGILGPGKRWGHTCNFIKGGRFLYVFGGYGKDNCQTNDVHVFDTHKHTWSKPMLKGVPPSPRDSHSCTTVGNNLFVFGGTDGKNPLKDLHILDTSSNTWISPSLRGEGPDAREGHSATLVDKRIFIFGGCGKSRGDPEEIYYNDLYILDTESLIWKHAVTLGTPPSARDSHTCSSWKNKIIVLGGEDASDFYLSDVHILDADTLVWKELNTSGQILAPRAGHSTVALGKNLFVFGGFTDDRHLFDDLHMLNVETGIWSKVTNAGLGPSARFSVAGDCLDTRKGILLFIGGCNENLEALDDMFYLYSDMSMENGQDEQRQEKFSIKKELQRKREEQYLPPANRVESEKVVPKHGVMSNSCQPVPLPSYSQAGKQNLSVLKPFEKTFEAIVTNAFHYGYTVETNIDGKTLRGLLFSCNPGFINAADAYVSRKRTKLNGGSVELNGGNKTEDKIFRSLKQEGVESSGHRQTDGIHGKGSTTGGSPLEALASNLNKSTSVDVTKPHMAPGNSEPSTASRLQSKDDAVDEHYKPRPEVPYESPAIDKEVASAPSNQDGSAPLIKERRGHSSNGVLSKST